MVKYGELIQSIAHSELAKTANAPMCEMCNKLIELEQRVIALEADNLLLKEKWNKQNGG